MSDVKVTPIFTRASRLLDNLVDAGKLSPEGKRFLICNLDPFHDVEVQSPGWPDNNQFPSIRRKVKQTISIANPFLSTAPTLPWDLHVTMWSSLDALVYSKSSLRVNNTFVFNSGDVGQILGGIQVWGVKTGTTWDPFNPATTVLMNTIALDPSYVNGISRITSIGMELTDTTPVIQKGGMVFVYKQPNNPRDAMVFEGFSPVDAASCTFSGLMDTLPPSTLNNVQLMPETRNWAFEKGAYVVGRFSTVENPPRAVDYSPPVYTYVDDEGASNSSTLIYQQMVTSGIGFGGITLFRPLGNRVYPIGRSGIWGSALPPGSTSNLTVVIETEGFPKPGSENSDLVIATQPMSLDCLAIEIMSRSIAQLPPGVPVGENGIGEWFFKIVDGIGKALSFIPHPFAQAGSLAARGIVMMQPKPAKVIKTNKGMRIAVNKPAPPPMPARLTRKPMARAVNPPRPPRPMERSKKMTLQQIRDFRAAGGTFNMYGDPNPLPRRRQR